MTKPSLKPDTSNPKLHPELKAKVNEFFDHLPTEFAHHYVLMINFLRYITITHPEMDPKSQDYELAFLSYIAGARVALTHGEPPQRDYLFNELLALREFAERYATEQN